jgi:AMP phosphorylase
MEALAPVDLSASDISRVVNKTKGCLVWGGALDLAPADDAFIKVEYPLGIDPLLLPSILSKKKAVGAKYVVVDIPTGRGAKIKTRGNAHTLSEKFIELGNRLGMNINCAITFGDQPLGYSMGPALEAREALLTLMGRGPPDVVEKVTQVAGILLEMVGKKNGKKLALQSIRSGKALRKFKEIIKEQGGNPRIKPSEIPIGKNKFIVKADTSGRVLWMKNAELAAIAREAGAPKDMGAGIVINKKMNDKVKKGDVLFTIYSNNTNNLNDAVEACNVYRPMFIGKSFTDKMLIDRIPAKEMHRRLFMLER